MPDFLFETVTLAELESLGQEARDELPFGIVGFDRSTIVEIYNATEARMAGLNPASVVGMPFFDTVGQCMNNFMVAQRYEDEPELDALVPYVLTLRMRPTRVRLRLLATVKAPRRYLLVER
jgi:photoactive yellow protein